MPAGQLPLQACVVPHGAGTVVVVVDVEVVVAQPLAVQASQQLGKPPTQELPPRGAGQFPLVVVHFVAPPALVRQQVTKPGLPQMV
jgi:hypothetical protein